MRKLQRMKCCFIKINMRWFPSESLQFQSAISWREIVGDSVREHSHATGGHWSGARRARLSLYSGTARSTCDIFHPNLCSFNQRFHDVKLLATLCANIGMRHEVIAVGHGTLISPLRHCTLALRRMVNRVMCSSPFNPAHHRKDEKTVSSIVDLKAKFSNFFRWI